ncbi:SprT family zinc-dependent metalloprotease [Polyangium sp. y55x31]|uniref:M48 family metallopeptidase n=1 Tax=Polyangium sp. y55x31 TaxID=3042688 RepID=UPI00248308D9|nr:SprT family zinc-dependent metalloprotease [Polyangium sp. y55x31]MDI1475687.1 SprT family zinc-dependent metalloprotease [Polyangium sp. y55x31]
MSGVRVSVVRKDIKNLHLGVYPPDGRVRVAAPSAVSDAAVRVAVIKNLAWIKRQRSSFEGQSRQSSREMVSGESHYFLGRRYRLRVVETEGAGRIVLRTRTILELHARAGSESAQRERILMRWYREQLRELVRPLLTSWQRTLGVEIAAWGIKRMKTQWGACNVTARRIWLNLELAKKPLSCIEYVVVHELVHLITRHHGERFTALMDRHLPKWRFLRQELNATPLAEEDWKPLPG